MTLQVLFHGYGTRKDFLIKPLPYDKFSYGSLFNESIWRRIERLVARSEMMQLPDWAENKSQILIFFI